MLTLTENASTIIKTLTARSAGSDDSGLRITGPARESGQYAVELVDSPQAADSVVEEGGARVFLEPDAADALDRMVLDANVSAEGGVQFSIAEQPAG